LDMWDLIGSARRENWQSLRTDYEAEK
jgi:hypothetical protein